MIEEVEVTPEDLVFNAPPMDPELAEMLQTPVEADLDGDLYGSLVDGTVTSIGDTVTVTLEDETVVKCALDESTPIGMDPAGLAVGDAVSVFIVGTTGDGHLAGSVALGALLRQHDRISAHARNRESTVSGIITHLTRGGFYVNTLGMRAFLPGRESGVPRALAHTLIGEASDFDILRVNDDMQPVLTRRRHARREQEVRRKEVMEQIKVGDIVTGTVTSKQPFGVFLDIGGVDGLLHVSELASEADEQPGAQMQIGDQIEVKIVSIDDKRGRIGLSRREVLIEQSQEELQALAPGSVVTGRVTRLADFGAFIEVLPAIEGLCHVSEMSWTERITHPSEVLSVGAEVQVKVLSRDGARISLSLRQTGDDPWSVFQVEHPQGSVVEGTIKRIETFGLFVELAPGIEGLCHISDLVWDGRPATPTDVRPFAVDEAVQVKVLQIDTDRRRISLGIKQLTDDPWELVADQLRVGNVIDATISRFEDHAAWARVGDTIEGRIHISELSTERVDSVKAEVRLDQVVSVKVLSADRDRRRIDLSIKAVILDDLAEVGTEYSDNETAGSSLGDLMKTQGLLASAVHAELAAADATAANEAPESDTADAASEEE
jgi:small subunit ribosomal protein S1